MNKREEFIESYGFTEYEVIVSNGIYFVKDNKTLNVEGIEVRLTKAPKAPKPLLHKSKFYIQPHENVPLSNLKNVLCKALIREIRYSTCANSKHHTPDDMALLMDLKSILSSDYPEVFL